MKNLLGILVLDRPKTTELCLSHLLATQDRKQFDIILIDNHSNEATQEVLKKYEPEVEEVIHNDWNVGYCFGVNQWLAKRDVGQHCVQIDSDLIMVSPDWWGIAKRILDDPDIGMVAGRRPTAWIDRPEKREGYKNLDFELRHGLWLEVPKNNFLIAPILIYKGELLDSMGFENEASGYGDLESPFRVRALGYKSVYIPDMLLYQLSNDWEVYDHPQRGAHMALLQRNAGINQYYIQQYTQGKKLYCGTRWLSETMTDAEYIRQSNENFEFHKNWGIK